MDVWDVSSHGTPNSETDAPFKLISSRGNLGFSGDSDTGVLGKLRHSGCLAQGQRLRKRRATPFQLENGLMRSAAKKNTLTLEQEITAIVKQSEALRDRAEGALEEFAELRRGPSLPRDSLLRLWEAKALTHCPFRALQVAMRGAGIQ